MMVLGNDCRLRVNVNTGPGHIYVYGSGPVLARPNALEHAKAIQTRNMV